MKKLSQEYLLLNRRIKNADIADWVDGKPEVWTRALDQIDFNPDEKRQFRERDWNFELVEKDDGQLHWIEEEGVLNDI